MNNEYGILKLKAERLGSVTEVKEFLTDLENAYNGIYYFAYLTDLLQRRYESNLKWADEERILEKYYKDPYFTDMFIRSRLKCNEPLLSIVELQSQLSTIDIIPPTERLIISRVNIQSPGFWEFLGGLNPLQQIREYLKDSHERKKDTEYRKEQERKMRDLEIKEKEAQIERDRIKTALEIREMQNNIMKQEIDLLKSIGYSDAEVQPILIEKVYKPLKQLESHQDTKLIEYPEDK
jgi:hypothetical protein